MNGTVPRFPYTPSWKGQGNLYSYFFTYVCGALEHDKMQCGKFMLVFRKNLLLSSAS